MTGATRRAANARTTNPARNETTDMSVAMNSAAQAHPAEEMAPARDRILILDFGSQVTQLIARRVREARVYCEIHPSEVSDEFVRSFAPRGVILSGSHLSVTEHLTDRAPAAVFELGVPVLGICYGMQTMAEQLGGKVETGKVREFGYAEVRARGHTKLLAGIEDFRTSEGHGMLKVWMSHGDRVTELPPGFKVMASTPPCSSTPKSRTRCRARRCSSGSCTASAAAAATGTCPTM
jgi:GMP synthase (glutamine-hydrolysing) A subunit